MTRRMYIPKFLSCLMSQFGKLTKSRGNGFTFPTSYFTIRYVLERCILGHQVVHTAPSNSGYYLTTTRTSRNIQRVLPKGTGFMILYPGVTAWGFVIFFYFASAVLFCSVMKDEQICPSDPTEAARPYYGWLTSIYFTSVTMCRSLFSNFKILHA